MPILTDIHTQIEIDRKAAFPKADEIKTFREYARGRQKGTLTRQQNEMLRGLTGHLFCDNVCRKVLTEAANRLELVRYDVAQESVAKFLNDLFVKNQMADLSGDVHYATLRDGNYATALRWDEAGQRVTLHKERWWNGSEGVFIGYNDDGTPGYAVKDWKAAEGLRRVIWFPDRIERYLASGEGWIHFLLPEDNNQWPVPWVQADGSPIGIPIIHFANGSDDDTYYGASELDGGVLGLQDEINDVQRDITTASRMTAYQMGWGTGVKLPKDSAGKDIPPKLGPGAFFTTEDPLAKYGTLPAGDLSQLQRSYTIKLQAVSRMTDTPLHFITGGDWPSGEALLRAEQPLIAKIQKLAKTIGPAWASVAHRATIIANVFNRAGLDTEKLITSVFASPDKRDPLTQADIASTIAPFVSEAEVLRTLGYSPEAIKKIQDEKIKEASNNQLLGVADLVPNVKQ